MIHLPFQDYKHFTPIEIRYGDIDMLQHVNNAAYLTYLEQARIKYSKDVLKWDGNWQTLNMILAKTTIEYKTPLFLNDVVGVLTKCIRLGNKSFELEYLFIKFIDDQPQIAATASSVMVAFNVVTQKSEILSEEFKKLVTDFEGL